MLITDLPCIISGDTFAILDPHRVNINCKDEHGIPLTGTEMSVTDLCTSSSLLSCYNGLFGFEMPLKDCSYYDGTIFRFPLRSPHAISKLSETTYSSEKVFQDLFCSLEEEAEMLLLFLKNITSISLYEYDQTNGKRKLLLNISIDSNRISQVQLERRKCIELAKEWLTRQNTVIRLYSLPVTITNAFKGEPLTAKSCNLVLNSIGSSDEEINTKAEQLKVIPWIGIAAPCSFSSIVENYEISVIGNEINMENNFLSSSQVAWQYIDPVVSGHAFCFLPLPNPTGLPVSINGYFSIADNRRSIKWPTHDEHGKGADFNKELVMKMVSYAYAVMITCRCQLVCYVDTPSYLSTELSDAYSIWPLISQVTNHPIWSCLVDPIVRLLTEQKVMWTAAGGGKWVKFTDAYYQPEDVSIPNAVIDVLLEIEIPFVVLPTAVLDSIKTVHHLLAVIKSREIKPDLLRRLLKQFPFIPRAMLYQANCIEILSYILSDFNYGSNVDSLLGINIIPLMDKTASPKQLSRQFNADMLYILENDECISFLPGISSCIITNNLSSEIINKLKQIDNINVMVADNEVVCEELLPLSLQQWQFTSNEQFSWHPGQGNHPPLKWIFNLWKWLANVDLNLIWNCVIVPQENLSSTKDRVEVVNLLSLSKCDTTSLTLDTDASRMDNKVAGLLKALGVIIIIKSTRIFQNSGLYDYLLDFTPKNVITVLTNNKHNLRVGSIQRWRANDKQIFFKYLSAAGDTLILSSAEVKLMKDLPIFREVNKQEYATLHNRNHFIVQSPFGLSINAVNVIYPNNVFYCNLEEAKFLRALDCTELTFYDYCVNYFVPFCAKQNAMQKKKNYQWLLSCVSLWCDGLTRYLQRLPLVTTASTQRMVKSGDLYDPNEPAISQLFNDSEDELPSHEYQQFLPQLRRLGLVTWNMIISNSQKYKQLLINRAQSVRTVLSRNGRESAMKRSLVVVTYLVDYFFRYDPSDTFVENIKSVKFLFCSSKPLSDYPTGLQWGGLNETKNVFSPNQLHCSENSLLVGGTGKVLSIQYSKFTSCTEFQDLFKVPDMITVIDQLNLLIASKPNSDYPTSVYAIYDYFNENLEEFQMHCDRLNSKWIWINNQRCFEDVSKFAMHPFSDKQLEPLCYAIVQAPQLLKYEQLFTTYGIPDVFPEDTMLNVISQLQQYTSKLSSSYLDVVISILDWVHETNRESEEVPDNILIPTNNCLLLPPEKCIFDDRGWSRDRHKQKKSVSGYSFTHRRLPLDTATFFGVKLLSQHLLPSVNLTLQCSLTGPHQSITGRIKEALEDYDQDIDVFKEMIQNAEDAGASEIKFVIDWRNHPTENLLTREMEAWQGPALFVYNNAVFSDKDFINICEIAGASKRIDPTKIGRFGVGFCSVYHITDVPSFISRNFYTVFDPNLLYLQERVTSTNPGMQIDFKASTTENLREFKDQFTPFCGLFHCDVFNKTKHFDGTLFRLPFRTEQTGRKSKISQEVYMKERINKLFKTVCNKASAMLMFLHNIKSISLYEMQQTSAMKCLLHVERGQTQPRISAPLVQLFKSNFQKVLTSENCQIRKFVIKSVKSEDHWIVTSCLGSGRSLEIAQSFEGRQKGLCPFGEIAIKLDPILLSPCKSVGSLFCFMPVPIKSNFHFLINGYFDISKDRRSLKKDANGSLTEWNSALIQDTIGKCFLQMLLHLDLSKAMKTDTSKCLEAYYSIWPHKVDKQGSDYSYIMYDSIKKLLLETDAELLWSHNKWVCHKNAYVYLNSPELPDDRKNETVSLLLKYGYPMVDIPSHVKDLLSPNINTLTYEEFCRNVLFENLKMIENDDVRNNQVIQLITYCATSTGWEYHLITENECIPTKPNGVLKKPKCLIDPNSSLAKLYSEEEECFPQDNFCEQTILITLRRCGMIFYKLGIEHIKERACTVANLPIDKAYNRSQEIVKYIIFNYESSSSSKLAEELSEIKFLPIMKCPGEITLPWYGTVIQFEAPCKIYSKIYQNVLFTQEPIFNSVEYIEILKILKQNIIPPINVILKHFKCLIYHWQDNKVNNEATNKLIGESCRAVYECLQKCDAIAKSDQYEEEFTQIKSEVGSLPFVWHSNQFLSVDNVVLKWNYVTYNGFLCELSKDMEIVRYEELFRLLGINECPTIAQCMSVLQRLHDEMNDAPLLPDVIEFCCGIAKYLVYDLSIADIKDSTDDKLLDQLYLPDESCIMRHVNNLAYKESIEYSSLDNSGILESHFKKNAYWLHPSFSGYIAKCLDIPSALESILNTISDDHEYEQQENLCDRINSLLDKYPNDTTMFKEFIQNAEDAGASEIAFILDQREFPAGDGELFSDSENWSKLHKCPSLLIYNNKTMTEDDLIGITKLGRGNKQDPLESIGRFGVGFNVAYHITDCPMFVSYGPGGVPENFCVLDPTCQYAPRATKQAPGQRWKLTNVKYVEQFSKQLKPFLDTETFGEFQKFSNSCMLELNEECVVFRLPLTKSGLYFPKSRLLPNSYMPVNKLQTLLESLAEDAHKLPLFIKNLKCISAFEISKDGECSHYFTTTITMDPESATSKNNFSENITCELSKIADSEFDDIEFQTVLYQKHIKTTIGHVHEHTEIQGIVSGTSKKDKEGTVEDWLISEQFGSEEMPRKMLIAGISAGLIPLAGVALKVNDPKTLSSNGSVFCSLPLPLNSYLPFHVNGHFWVDDSCKHLETGATDSPLSKWNECLTTTVIPFAYLAAIKECRKYIDFNKSSDTDWYYSLFPYNCLNKDSKLHAFGLVKCMYASMITADATILQKQHLDKSARQKMEWISIKQACFLSDKYSFKPKENEILRGVILAFKLNLTNAPIQIYDHIESNKLECSILITPEFLIKFIKSISNIGHFEDLIKCNINVLLNYCLLVSKEYDDKIEADRNEAKSLSKGKDPKNLSSNEISSNKISSKGPRKNEIMTALFTGVPLLLTHDGCLRKFNPNKPVYYYDYAKFFSHRSEDFIDQRLEECNLDLLKECGFIQVPTVSYLAQHTAVHNSTKPVSLMNVPDIENFWTCLHYISRNMLFGEVTSKELFSNFKSKPIILGSDQKLYPLYKGKMVLRKLKHCTPPAFNVMIQLGYPTLNTDHKIAQLCASLFSGLVASPVKSDDIVECIHLHQKTFNTSCFSWSEEDLRPFMNLLSSSSFFKQHNYDYFDSVCQLPIFKTFDKKFEPLNQYRILLPNEYEIMPTSGLELIGHHSNKQILIPEGIYSQIYTSLHVTSPSLEDFYTEYICRYMNKEDIFKHIDLLRSRHCITEKASVSLALQSVPFMEHKTVSEYYDPEIEVFRTFLPSNAFPPSPWNDNTWLPVLRILGLQTIVTGKKLIEFAKIVENISHICGDIACSIKKAKVLLCAIGERLCDKIFPEHLDFCEELSSINFIPTFISRELKVLLQTFTKENIDEYFEYKFISFKESIIPHHQGVDYYHISFASNAVIDWSLENLQCSKSDQDFIAQLHMNVPPSCAIVVDNLLILSKLVTSTSLQSTLNFHQQVKYVDELQDLFDAHYRFLENCCSDNNADILRLQNENCIFVRYEESKNSFKILHSAKLVKFLPESFNFSFYLFQMPKYFSKYIQLIRIFKIQEMPTSLQFAEILKEIYFEIYLAESFSSLQSSYLCLIQAEAAYVHLLESLRKENANRDRQIYYLLDENNELYPQNELVYDDAPWYRGRLGNCSYHFLKQPVPKSGNFFLPKYLKVRLLSSMVMEEISDCTFVEDNECVDERFARQSPEQSNGCEYVVSLKSIIKSLQFKTGLRRIIYHETGNAPSHQDDATIGKLDDLEFKCYHNIETVLKHINTNYTIPGSKQSVFCAIHDKNQMCIKIDKDVCTSKLSEIVYAVSQKLNLYLNYIVWNEFYITEMIKSDLPEDIEKKLDLLHIQQYNERKSSTRITVGKILKKGPTRSDQVIFDNFTTKEQVIYWNSEGKGILSTIQSIQDVDDINFSNSITLTVNDNKDTEDTTLFCISKLLHPTQIQSLNLDGQQREQAITGDLLLYDIPHESEDKAVAWINSIVKYCDTLPPQQHNFVLERLKFYAHYYIVFCNEAQHIYNAIANILDSAFHKIKSLLQILQDDDENISHHLTRPTYSAHSHSRSSIISQRDTAYQYYQPSFGYRLYRPSGAQFGELMLKVTQTIQASVQKVTKQKATNFKHEFNAFCHPRSIFICPYSTTCGYFKVPSGGYRLNPVAASQIVMTERKPSDNIIQEAQVWYHQASADYHACKCLIESTTTSSMPGDFKSQHCSLVCFLSHEIVDLCLKALCYAFVGLSSDLRNASNILIFYKKLISSSNCPALDIEQYVHQVSEYDRSTRFPDAHVPSEPPCCVYDETDAYNAFNAAQNVFKCVGEKLSSTYNQGIMTFPSIPVKKGS